MANYVNATPNPPETWDSSKFSVGAYTYPGDLMSNTAIYGGNWVIFRISVHEDSYLAKGGAELASNVANAPPGETNLINGTVANLAPTVAAGAAAFGSDAAGKAAGTVGVNLSTVGSNLGNAGIAIGTGAAIATSIGSVKKGYKTLKDAICLYMPGDLSIRYGATWSDTDLDTTTALMQGASEAGVAALKVGAGMAAGKAVDKLSGGKTKGWGTTIGGIVGGISAINNLGNVADMTTAQALKTPGVGEMTQKSSGTAPNPKKEQLFRNVEYRTFQFTYQFHPRSEAEAKSVMGIIKLFKLHMHPEFRDANQFLYIYPSEFDVVYYTGGQENLNLHQHTSAVLTDMSISYTPQGQFNAFPNGMPSQINVTLNFKELALLTKKDIDGGY